MKQLYLIAYDISKNRTRNKIADLLAQYGERINLSVFECLLTAKQKEHIIEELHKLINPKTDSIRIYFICSACYSKSIVIGRPDPPEDYSVFI